MEWHSTPLAELNVIVLDLQSSGATPKHGHPIEVAWATTHGSRDNAPVEAHLMRPPEGSRIPSAVRRITGISSRDLKDAAGPEAGWRALHEAARGVAAHVDSTVAPTVIHFASFETRFLQDLHQRFSEHEAFPFDIICTHKIAKRLHPDLPRRGLRALAGYYGFPVELLRRSEGHVAATVFAWHHLVLGLAEQDVTSWATLQAWQSQRAASTTRGKRSFPMPRNKRLSLPDRPGIYRFLRTTGDVLYVGKATSLKKRVNSYFTKRKGHDERLLEMLSQARDLSVTETASALEAAVMETTEIKSLAPPYNIHLRDEVRQVWFTSCDYTQADREPSDACPIGPWPSRFWLSSMVALCRVLDGDVADDTLMARAVSAAPQQGPERGCFEAGVEVFSRRYGVDALPGRHARQRLTAASKAIAKRARAGLLDEGGNRDESEPQWDPERVARHLERIVLNAGQLARRARWICLLSNATVAWRETSDAQRRVLTIQQGTIVHREFSPAERPLAPPPSQPSHRERQRCIDIATYDRLRVLSTELRRLHTTSEVAVRLSDRPALSGAALRSVLDGA